MLTAAVPLALLSAAAHADTIGEDCTFRGVALYGDVQIVDSFPDFEVRIADSFADLRVQRVDSVPDACGKWRFVESFPDFTVKFVDSFPDFEIIYVDSFPGLP